jgi:hypothetical protein
MKVKMAPLKVLFRVGGMAQVEEPLPSKHKALNSNPITIKKKNLVCSL